MNASTEMTPDTATELQNRTQHDAVTSAPSTPGGEHAVVAEESPESVAQTANPTTEAPRARKPRGFAAMDRSLVSAIARKGGKAAHEAGTAHEFTREEAREAGRKGGQATHAKRRAKTEEQAS